MSDTIPGNVVNGRTNNGLGTAVSLASLAIPGAGWIGPAISGAAAVGGSLIGKHSNNKANDTQAKAAADALALQKDNEMERRKEYNDSLALQKAQWDAEQARLAPRRAIQDQLLAKYASQYGMNLGSLAGAASPVPFAPGGVSTANSATASPRTLASLAGPTGDPMVTPSPANNLGNVFDWSNSVGGQANG